MKQRLSGFRMISDLLETKLHVNDVRRRECQIAKQALFVGFRFAQTVDGILEAEDEKQRVFHLSQPIKSKCEQ